MSGKGDKYRKVNRKKWEASWERIYRQKKALDSLDTKNNDHLKSIGESK